MPPSVKDVDIRGIHSDHRAVLKRPGILVACGLLLAIRTADAAPPKGTPDATPGGPAPRAEKPTASKPPASTTAEGSRMAVATFGPPSLGADLGTRLEDAAAAGLAANGAIVTPRAEVLRAQGVTGVGPCTDAGCLQRLAAATATPIWLRGSCTVEGTTYRAHLELFDATANEIVGARDDACEICTEADVAETVNVAASTLRATWKHAPRAISPIASNGSAVGAGPPAVPSGARLPSPPAPAGASRSALVRALPFIAFGGAAVAGGLGIFFVHENGKRVDGFNGGGMATSNLVDTKNLAIASFGVGALLLGTGIVLLAVPAASSAAGASGGDVDSSTASQAPRAPAVSLGFTGTGMRIAGTF